MDHIDAAAQVLQGYGVYEPGVGAREAAVDAIRAAAKDRIAEYYDESEGSGPTARAIILTRIDTLMKFAGLTEDDLKD